MAFRITSNTSGTPQVSSGMSNISNPSESKFGFNIGEQILNTYN